MWKITKAITRRTSLRGDSLRSFGKDSPTIGILATVPRTAQRWALNRENCRICVGAIMTGRCPGPRVVFCGHGWGVSVPCEQRGGLNVLFRAFSFERKQTISIFLLVKVTEPACVLTKFVKLGAIGKLHFGGDCPFVWYLLKMVECSHVATAVSLTPQQIGGVQPQHWSCAGESTSLWIALKNVAVLMLGLGTILTFY